MMRPVALHLRGTYTVPALLALSFFAMEGWSKLDGGRCSVGCRGGRQARQERLTINELAAFVLHVDGCVFEKGGVGGGILRRWVVVVEVLRKVWAKIS